jgi:hypothetical protein
MKKLISLLLCVLLLCGCAVEQEATTPTEPTEEPTRPQVEVPMEPEESRLKYEGVRLTYGMSIDYLAMPGIEKDTAQRGGELITIHRDGSWDLKQIPLVSIEK